MEIFCSFFSHKYMYVILFSILLFLSFLCILVYLSLTINVCTVCKTNCNAYKYLYNFLFFSLPVSFLLFPCTVSSNTNKSFLLQKKKKKKKKIRTLMFRHLLAIKHPRLRDSEFRSRFGRGEVWVWSPTKNKKLPAT